MRQRVDVVTLGSGIGVITVGGALLLDQAGTVELTLGVVGALLAGLVGMMLVLSGLDDHPGGEGEP